MTTTTETSSVELRTFHPGSVQTSLPVNSKTINRILSSKWAIVASAASVVFVGVGIPNAYGVFQSYYETTLFPSIPPSQLILIGSTSSSIYMITGLLTGRAADVYGYQASLWLGSALMVASLFAASVAHQYYQLLLTQGIMFGLGVSFAYYPAVTITQQYFEQNRRGLANGIVVSGGALGGCILPYLVQILIERQGLARAFRVLGYFSVGMLIPSVIVLKSKVPRPPRGTALIDQTLLRDSRFLVLLSAGTVAMTGFLPRYFLIPSSAIESGIDETYSSWLLGMMNGLSIFGRIGIGMFADRYGKVLALMISFVACGSGHLLFWLPGVLVSSEITATAMFTLFVVYVGLLGSGFVSLIPVVVGHLFGTEAIASKVGLLNSIMGLGVLAGPSAVYAIVNGNGLGGWVGGVVTSGLLMVIGGLAMTNMSRRS